MAVQQQKRLRRKPYEDGFRAVQYEDLIEAEHDGQSIRNALRGADVWYRGTPVKRTTIILLSLALTVIVALEVVGVI